MLNRGSRAVVSMLLAACSLGAFAGQADSPVQEPAYQMAFTATLVQFDDAISTERFSKVIARAFPGDQQEALEAAAKTLAGGDRYEVLSGVYLQADDGVPQRGSSIRTSYIAKTEESWSPDGKTKTVSTKAIPQRVGFDLVLTASVRKDSPDQVVTSARIEHGALSEEGGLVSTVNPEGESALALGEYQVIPWTNAGKSFAMLIRLDRIQPAQ